jgi:hypothetical protein
MTQRDLIRAHLVSAKRGKETLRQRVHLEHHRIIPQSLHWDRRYRFRMVMVIKKRSI